MERDKSLNKVIEELKNKGYTHIFFKKNNFILCKDPEMNFHTHELQIEEVYRGAEPGDLSAPSVIYKIESTSLGIKGLLLNHH